MDFEDVDPSDFTFFGIEGADDEVDDDADNGEFYPSENEDGVLNAFYERDEEAIGWEF